jgi:hypothetical protein
MTPEQRERNLRLLLSPWGAAMLVVVMSIEVAIESGLEPSYRWHDWFAGLIIVAATMACLHAMNWLYDAWMRRRA